MLKLNFFLSLITLGYCVPALAQIGPASTALSTAPAASSGDSSLTLGEVTVTAPATGTLNARSVLTSVDILRASVVQDQRVDYSWELFNLAPGVQVTPFRQGTDAGRFSFRAFNGEGRVNAVKLLIDGVPSNDSSGGMPFLDAVWPLDIDAIEIVRGTNDPRYGLHNIAGNANVRTRIGGNEGRASITAGSLGTRDVQLSKGLESGNWSQNYFIGWRDSEGWRDHADARKFALAGKWFYTTDDGAWRGGLIARYYRNEALESGYLTREQAMLTPRASPAHSQSDRSERQTSQLSAHLDGQLRPDLSWSFKVYSNQYENQRWVRFSAAGRQQERDNDERHWGGLSSLTWRPQVGWAHEFALEGGVDFERQSNINERYRTTERIRTATLRQWDSSLDTEGAYVQAVIRPIEALRIVPAYRVDRIGGSLWDGLAGRRYEINDYGLVHQPKLSVVYTLSPQASVYANWGRTFQIGTGLDAYQTQASRLRPSINDGRELGLKFTPAPGLEGRVAYWEQRASGEVARVLGVNGVASSTDLSNVGRTRRQGVDLQLNYRADARTTAWVAYSRQDARIVVPDPSAPATAGRQIENVPPYLASAGIDHQLLPQLKLSAWVNAQGDYFLDRTNTLGKAGRYTLFNVAATWRISPTWDVHVQVKNLTDRRYVYAWYDSGTYGYSPGDGRAFLATLTMKF